MRMIREWWRRHRERSATEVELEALLAHLETSVEQRDISKLVPILCPADFLRADWPGPIEPIPEAPFALAWSIVKPAAGTNLWAYVTAEMAAFWEKDDIDWKQVAFDNLRQISNPGANGDKCDGTGRPFVLVMLQPDAVGPSRLLLPHLFDEDLGPGYRVAVPERTCAVAFRRVLADDQLADVNAMIAQCFENGTEPVSGQTFDAAVFWEPALRHGW
jgi:hypothetical protein